MKEILRQDILVQIKQQQTILVFYISESSIIYNQDSKSFSFLYCCYYILADR